MSASLIKEKRLSEDSTSSEGSGSGDSTDGTDGHNSDASSDSMPRRKLSEEIDEDGKDLLDNHDDHMKWLLSYNEIAGRYTEKDHNFANDVERRTPPLVLGYNPRVYNRGGHSGHQRRGGRGDFRQNRGWHGYSHNSNHGNEPYQRHDQRQPYIHRQPQQQQHKPHPYRQGNHGHNPEEREHAGGQKRKHQDDSSSD